MFEQLPFTLPVSGHTRTSWFIPLAALGHGLVLLAIALTPLLSPVPLPVERLLVFFDNPSLKDDYPPPTPPTPPTARPANRQQPRIPGSSPAAAVARNQSGRGAVAPVGLTENPPDVPIEWGDPVNSSDLAAGPGEAGPGVVPGSAGGWTAGPWLPQTKAAPGPAPPPPRQVVPASVLQARLVKKVEPVYPEVARRSRVHGSVMLQVVVGPDGRVETLKVLGGHPLLTKAALDAVSQWEYTPALINHTTPVAVLSTVTVHFVLY